jgi:uncharacterized repeat protein (TIGR02543 family)
MVLCIISPDLTAYAGAQDNTNVSGVATEIPALSPDATSDATGTAITIGDDGATASEPISITIPSSESYIVTYNAILGGWGETHTTTQSIEYDANYTFPENPTWTGYDFLGWFTSEDVADAIQVATSSAFTLKTDQELFASWSAIGIDDVVSDTPVVASADDASDAVPPASESSPILRDTRTQDDAATTAPTAPTTLTTPTALSKPTTPVKPTQPTTKSTSNSAAVSAPAAPAATPSSKDTKTAAGSVSTLATKYTATFKANGGGTVKPATIKKNSGTAIGKLPTVTRTGYKLKGWYTAKSGGTKISTTTKLTKNVTYYARWTINQYTATFKANGGGTVKPATIKKNYNTAISKLPTVSRTGYKFKGWYTAKSGGSKISTKTKITKNVTYYAQWTINQYTATFNANGGGTVKPATIKKNYNTAIGTPPTVSRANYTLKGWYTAKSGGTKIDATTKLTKNVTYYAQWTIKQYTATFNANGGGTVSPATIKKNYNTAIGTLPTVTKTGYTFNGWYTAATGGSKIDAATLITKNVTYYAQWAANQYTVTFDANGGDPVTPSSITKDSNVAIGTLPAPTRAHYTFNGWYTAATGGTKIEATTLVTQNITYYAQWTINQYTATFDTMGGEPATLVAISKDYNTAIGILPAVTKTGYLFNGWYTESVGGTPINATEPVTQNITYYAQWIANTYTVTYDANTGAFGSVTTTTKSIAYNSKYSLPAEPTKANYTFIGWFTESGDASGTQVTTSTTMNKTTNHTLYARWKNETQIALVFDANGGSTANPSTIYKAFGAEIGTLPTSTRNGYTLKGWYTAKSGGTEITTATIAISDATYYAQWTPNSYAITYDGNGGTFASGTTTTKAITYMDKYSLPENPTRTGYSFAGWFTVNAATGGDQITAATAMTQMSNHTLYARWSNVTLLSITINETDAYGSIELYQWIDYSNGSNGGYWSYVGMPSTSVNGAGTYIFDSLSIGNYIIRYYDDNGNYVSNLYFDKDGKSYSSNNEVPKASGIHLNSPTTISNIQLVKAASISVKIDETDASGWLYAQGWVEDDDNENGGYWYSSWGSVYINGAGTYKISGLPAGTYLIYYDNYSSNYVSTNIDKTGATHDSRDEIPKASGITLTAGQAISVTNITLSKGASISVQINETDANGYLVAYRWIEDSGEDNGGYWSGNYSSRSVNGAGTYKIDGLHTGNYIIYYGDNSSNYVSMYYDKGGNSYSSDNEIQKDSGLALTTAQVATYPGIQLFNAGSLSVKIDETDADGGLYAYRWVDNSDEDNGGYWQNMNYSRWIGDYGDGDDDGSAGIYKIGSLPPGTYIIRYYDYDENYRSGYYDVNGKFYSSSSDIDKSAGIVLAEGQSKDIANIQLSSVASISVTITEADADGVLYAYRWIDDSDEDNGGYWSNNYSSRYVDGAGTYKIDGLDEGNYIINYCDYSSKYHNRYYDKDGNPYHDSYNISYEQGISLESAQATTLDNIELVKSASISVEINESDAEGYLQAYRWHEYSGYGNGGYWSDNYGLKSVDGAGTYKLSQLEEGRYIIRYSDSSSNYVSTYYDKNGDDFTDCNAIPSNSGITLIDGQSTTLSDISLIKGASISMILNKADARGDLEVYKWIENENNSNGGSWGTWDSYSHDIYVNGAKTYKIGSLPAGDYIVRYSDSSSNYISLYYDKTGKSYDSNSEIPHASGITLPAAGAATLSNIQLVDAGSMSVTIDETDAYGYLKVYRWVENHDSGEGGNWQDTNSNSVWIGDDDDGDDGSAGTYKIGSLPPGKYIIRYYDYDENYMSAYYDKNGKIYSNSSDIAESDGFIVIAKQTTTVSNIHLSKGASISVEISESDAEGYLLAYRWHEYSGYGNGGYWSDNYDSVSVNGDGTYKINRLHAGTYILRYYDDNGNYISTYYDKDGNTYTSDDNIASTQGTNLELGQAQTLSNIELIKGASISVEINESDAEGYLRAYRWYEESDYGNSGYWSDNYGSVSVNGDGTYKIGSLPAGDYIVYYNDDSSNYISAYFDKDGNTYTSRYDISSNQGTNLELGQAQTQSNIELTEAGSISVTINEADFDGKLIAYRWIDEEDSSSGGYWDETKSVSIYDDDDDDTNTYKIGSLPQGNYIIRYYDWSNHYMDAYYDNTGAIYGSASDLEKSAGVTVTAKQTSNITNIKLSKGASISVAISDADAEGTLSAYKWIAYNDGSGNGYWSGSYGYVAVAGNGTYQMNRLGQGTYIIRYQDDSGNYINTYYDKDGKTYANYSDIPITSGLVVVAESNTSVSNITLVKGASISAALTEPDAQGYFQPYKWIAYDDESGDGYWVTYWDNDYYEISVDGAGIYKIGSLPDGNYILRYYEYNGDYMSTYFDKDGNAYDNSSTIPSSSGIVLAKGGASLLSNITLVKAASISVTIDDTDAYGYLYVYKVENGSMEYSNYMYIYGDDTYKFGGLKDGNYIIEYYDRNTYESIYYDKDGNAYEHYSDIPVELMIAVVAGYKAELTLH